MQVPINVKSPNNISKWQMGFNSAFKGLMLYREIIAVCSQIQTKHINALCGQNVEFLNVKAGSTVYKASLRLSKVRFRI
jgi:hypothetical protein